MSGACERKMIRRGTAQHAGMHDTRSFHGMVARGSAQLLDAILRERVDAEWDRVINEARREHDAAEAARDLRRAA